MNTYIRISNPAVWMVLVALCCLAGAVIVWGITGKLPSTVQAVGVVQGEAGREQIYCYLPYEDAAMLEEGDAARIAFRNLPEDEYGYLNGKIEKIGVTPLSQEEVSEKFSYDWLTQNLITATYSVEIVIVPEQASDTSGQNGTEEGTQNEILNGYAWSKEAGSSAVIVENTLADVAFVTEEVRPVDFLLN